MDGSHGATQGLSTWVLQRYCASLLRNEALSEWVTGVQHFERVLIEGHSGMLGRGVLLRCEGVCGGLDLVFGCVCVDGLGVVSPLSSLFRKHEIVVAEAGLIRGLTL